MADLPDWARLVNCAGCGRELFGEGVTARARVWLSALGPEEAARLPAVVRGRILGRPYCSACLESRGPPAGRGTTEDDGGPWQQNAVRELEDAGG